jgi:hypothetical protein
MVNLIIDWFFLMSFVENLLSEVSDQRKPYTSYSSKATRSPEATGSLSIDCTIIKGLFGMSCFTITMSPEEKNIFQF